MKIKEYITGSQCFLKFPKIKMIQAFADPKVSLLILLKEIIKAIAG